MRSSSPEEPTFSENANYGFSSGTRFLAIIYQSLTSQAMRKLFTYPLRLYCVVPRETDLQMSLQFMLHLLKFCLGVISLTLLVTVINLRPDYFVSKFLICLSASARSHCALVKAFSSTMNLFALWTKLSAATFLAASSDVAASPHHA